MDIIKFNFACDGNFANTFDFGECSKEAPVTPQDYEIEIEFNSAYPLTYKLNNVSYTATTSPLQANLSDYGLTSVDEITSWYFGNSNVTKVKKLPFGRNITSTNSMFQGCGRLESCITNTWDMSGVKDANFMFSYCANLQKIVFPSSFKPTTVWGMFGGSGIEGRFDFNTKDCTNVKYLYYDCKNLNFIDFGAMESNQLIDSMFEGCTNLEFTDGNFWPNNVNSASNLFKDCVKLPMNTMVENNTIAFLLYDGRCTNMSGLFYGTNWGENYDFQSYRLGQWNLAQILNCSYLFAYSNISKIEINSNEWYLRRCQDFSYMFANMPNLTQVYFSVPFENATSLNSMFANCPNLEEIELYITNSPTSDCDFSYMFDGCTNLRYLTITMPNGTDCDFINNIRNAINSAGLETEIFADGCAEAVSKPLAFRTLEYTQAAVGINGTQYSFNDNNDEEVSIQVLTQDYFDNQGIGELNYISFSDTYIREIISIPYSNTLTSITVSNCYIDYLDFSSVNMNILQHFNISNLEALTMIDFSNWETVTDDLYYNSNYTFENLPNLKVIKLFNCSDVVKEFLNSMMERGGISNVIMITESNDYYIVTKSDTSLIDVNIDGTTQPLQTPITVITDWGYSSLNTLSLSSAFEGTDIFYFLQFPSVDNIDQFQNFFKDTTMLRCFNGNVLTLNPYNGNDLTNFFYNSPVTWVDLSGWDLSNASGVESMFWNCYRLTTVFAYGCNEETIYKLQEAINNSGYSITLYY